MFGIKRTMLESSAFFGTFGASSIIKSLNDTIALHNPFSLDKDRMFWSNFCIVDSKVSPYTNVRISASSPKSIAIKGRIPLSGRASSPCGLTLEFCITQDVRVNYHVLTYARNAIRYFEKYGWDNYAEQYVNSALKQLSILLNSGEYIYQGTLKELNNLQKQLDDIKKMI